MLFLKK